MRKALYFLGILSDSDIDWLISSGRRERVPAGRSIIREGTEIDYVYIVLDGELAVTLPTLDTHEIARLRSGEIVGEMSFVDSRLPSASVTAVHDSLLLAVPKAALRQRLTETEFAARFYRALCIFLADRLRNTVSRLGYGQVDTQEIVSSADDEINPDLLENLSMAGAKFDWLLRRLRGEQEPIT